MAQWSQKNGVVTNMGNFVLLTIFYFFYQAAFGGLFLLVGKSLQSYSHYQLLLALFASAEPLIIILFGIYISRMIDTMRNKDAESQTSSYLYLTVATLSSFLLFFYFFVVQKSLLMGFITYLLVSISFSAERIYRQRFPRDYSVAYNIHLHRINSVNNLVTRGTPLIIPLVLVLFPQGLNFTYISSFIILAFTASLIFSYFFCKVSQTPSIKGTVSKTSGNNGEGWGKWHVIHLSLMNFAFGAMYLILAQPVLSEISLKSFMQSPVPLYAGFLGTMIYISLGYLKKPETPLEGLNLVVIMGILLTVCSICTPLLSGILLFIYGSLFALAINKIGTCVQQNLDYGKYSYYETRAQTYGRIASLISMAICGFLLDKGFAFQKLELFVGIIAIIAAIILRYSYKILIETSDKKYLGWSG
ncbi:MAG: hypothetical protein H0U73_05160 [Tatlockia sp.]|nr:hypothetical protein [Tatlockia sp.]